jgi:hypothetical protein
MMLGKAIISTTDSVVLDGLTYRVFVESWLFPRLPSLRKGGVSDRLSRSMRTDACGVPCKKESMMLGMHV